MIFIDVKNIGRLWSFSWQKNDEKETTTKENYDIRLQRNTTTKNDYDTTKRVIIDILKEYFYKAISILYILNYAIYTICGISKQCPYILFQYHPFFYPTYISNKKFLAIFFLVKFHFYFRRNKKFHRNYQNISYYYQWCFTSFKQFMNRLWIFRW